MGQGAADPSFLGQQFMNVRCIAQGPAGKKYTATKPGQKELVVLKEVNITELSPEQRPIFEMYLSIVKNLLHNNVVRYTAFFEQKVQGVSYLESEYCALGSVQDMIEGYRLRNQPIPEEKIWRVAAYTIFALAYLHGRFPAQYFTKDSYRCLRPTSILIADNDVIKIDDFSTTRLPHQNDLSNTLSFQVYIAPEISTNNMYGPAADIWSLGCILLFMCTLEDPPETVKIRAPDASFDFSQIDGIRRYSSELLELIKACLFVSFRLRISVAQLSSWPKIRELLSKSPAAPTSPLNGMCLSPQQMSLPGFSASDASLHYSKMPYLQQMQPPGLNVHKDMGQLPNMHSSSCLQPYSLQMAMGSGEIGDMAGMANINPLALQQMFQLHQQMMGMPYMSISQQQPQQQQQVTSPTSMSEVIEETNLMTAVRTKSMPGLFDNIRQLKMKKADQTTALMIAAEVGNADALPYLLGEYRSQRIDGKTALMLAIINGHAGIAKVLADFESKKQDENGRTALMHACENKMNDLVSILAESEAAITDANGHTALMISLQHENIEATKIMVEKEAKIGLADGTTPLTLAEHLGNEKLIEIVAAYLQPKNEDTNCSKDIENSTSDDWISNTHQDRDSHVTLTVYDPPVELNRGVGWSKNNEGTTNLMEAARIGTIYGIKQYIHEKKMKDSKGWTALMKAAFYGHADCIPLLKQEMKMTNNAKYTALMSAAGNGYPECVRQLLSETKMRNWKGETALMLAILNDQKDCVELLLEQEGSMKTLNDNLTMLEYAKRHNKPRSIDVIQNYYSSREDDNAF